MDDRGRIFVAGHSGLVGRALVSRLKAEVGDRLLVRDRSDLDLTAQSSVDDFFRREKPSFVYLCAARVGGILDNSRRPADFIRDNLLIQTNVIDAAYRYGVRKLLFLGSSCIYPKLAPQPLKPEYLFSGDLEETNRSYAIAKLAGVEMCRAYRAQHGFDAIVALPTNLYGPGDTFDVERSHVIPALIRRFVEAVESKKKVVKLWGTGRPLREFLYVDDLANAMVVLMERYSATQAVNIGTGADVRISELATLVAGEVGFDGQIQFDPDFPDGTPRKVLDVEPMISLGWQPRVDLAEGIRRTLSWYRTQRVLS